MPKPPDEVLNDAWISITAAANYFFTATGRRIDGDPPDELAVRAAAFNTVLNRLIDTPCETFGDELCACINREIARWSATEALNTTEAA